MGDGLDRLTHRASTRVGLAALRLLVPLFALAPASWAQALFDAPTPGARIYLSGDPKNPIEIVSSTDTSVTFRWGKKTLEAVGVFHVRPSSFHNESGVDRRR